MKANEAVLAAERLSAAVAARSVAQLASIYADDLVVWHGSTRAKQTKTENLGMLAILFEITSALEYLEIRRHEIDGGLVQQHRLTGRFADGSPLPSLEACMVIRTRGGKISQIDEYFDGAQFAEVWERLAAHAARSTANA
jgi:ketosteroid isomerase-like protein